MDCLLGGGSEGCNSDQAALGLGRVFLRPNDSSFASLVSQNQQTHQATWSRLAVINKEFRWKTKMQRNVTGWPWGKINLKTDLWLLMDFSMQGLAGLCSEMEDRKDFLHAIYRTLNMIIMYVRSRPKKTDRILIKYKIYYKNTTTTVIFKGNSYLKSVIMIYTTRNNAYARSNLLSYEC